MTGVILRGWLLGTALNMAGHEGNNVVERIYFHSCEYSWNHHRHNISRDVAGGAAGELQGWPEAGWPILGHGWQTCAAAKTINTDLSTIYYHTRMNLSGH